MLSVLVPYRPDGGYRDSAWEWVRRRWETLLPEAEIVIGSDGGGANAGQFNHPLSINRAAHEARGDVLLIADADTAFEPGWVRRAAACIGTGAPWVLPRYYIKYTAAATAVLLASPPGVVLCGEEEWRGDSVSVSGLVVIGRTAFETIGGYDERFVQWGADDVCFASAADTLVGPAVRVEGAAYHLWHPAPLEETYGHDDHRRQYELMEQYIAARGDAQAMREVMG